MKIAVVYNRESTKVINLFGIPNREKYGYAAIARIVNSLKDRGHQVAAFEGDKDLIDNLEAFMPRAIKGEQLGMVFNLSYGIQGQARYTHVPSILEMVGIPYVGSGPLAHSLALDKVVAKMLFEQNGLPTPKYAVLQQSEFAEPDLPYPMIVKPKNEAVSFGIKVVNNEAELREAAERIFSEFQQPVLVEQFIEGREINVGILGNGPQAEALPPAELIFGEGPQIYTLEDKKRESGRAVEVKCPAPLTEEQTEEVKTLALKAFQAIGCYDCARIDFRMDKHGKFYILEINSLPSLGEHGSYVAAAEVAGLSFGDLVNRLVDLATARYFGTARPPQLDGETKAPAEQVFHFLTSRRDRIEKSIESWVNVGSRTDDPVGLKIAAERLHKKMKDCGLVLSDAYTDRQDVWLWQSRSGFENGTLLIVQIDVPVTTGLANEPFRKDPERLFGEGVGVSRAPLVQLEYALKSLKDIGLMDVLKVGVLAYADEGRDCAESAPIIARAGKHAARVLVLDTPSQDHKLRVKSRGHRRYRISLEGRSLELGRRSKHTSVMRTLSDLLPLVAELDSGRPSCAVSTVDIKTDAFPRRLPHRIVFTVQVSYVNEQDAKKIEAQLRNILKGFNLKSRLWLVSDRPPQRSTRRSKALFEEFAALGSGWDIRLTDEASLWPSVAGLVHPDIPVLAGLGPHTEGISTSHESVSRVSVLQKTLLVAQFLLRDHVGEKHA